MNKRLKKLTATLLSIVMVFSMVTEAFPAAFAAAEAGSGTPSTREDTKNLNFGESSKTRRPGLYVDFLGDNKNYQPYQSADDENERDTVLTGAADPILGALVAPGLIDQSQVTNKKTDANPKGTVNTWHGYQQNETYTAGGGSIYDGNTIFWVAVGINRMNQLELFKEKDNGIYGLELGFYYDSTFIEPYTGTISNNDTDYLRIIQAANLTNYEHYKWDGYSIVDARTNLTPQTDPVTQEVIQGPDMDEIMGRDLEDGETNPWKMTYVSIEKTNVDKLNRFTGAYDDKVAEDDLETQYLLLIPFRLKAYDPNWNQRVCLRLARSAGLLSIGSGEGDTPYTAWERVTTRNPGHELKLMTNFQGDLNIFSGGKKLEDPYNAQLIIKKAGGDNNSAKLTINNDPSPNPVFADTTGQIITGLYGGTGMKLDVHVDTGYSVTVKVYYSDEETTNVTYVELPISTENDKVYTFVMPEHNVTVEVIFEVTTAAEFWLNLYEREQDAAGTDATGTGIKGNSTVLTGTYTETDNTVMPPTTTTTVKTVDKDSSTHKVNWAGESIDMPAEKIHYTAQVTADVKVHGDYEAVIQIHNLATGDNIAPVRNTPTDSTLFPTDGIVEAGNVIVLPTGGHFTFNGGMPESDVVVEVVYRPAKKYKAILEVHHENILPKPENVAQLATTVYTKDNVAQAAYSGVVYQDDNGTNDELTDMADDNHRAVKDPFRVIDRVDVSSAAGSGSLGGDGRAPAGWNENADGLMALLAKAVVKADLGTVKPLDLRWNTGAEPTVPPAAGTGPAASVRQPDNGIRKNALGERYTDQDITDFYDRLWELKGLADAAIAVEAGGGATSPVHLVDVPDTANPGQNLYSYYDLTWQQVQAYILDYESRQKYEADQAQYVLDKAKYDQDLIAYNQYLSDKAAADAAGQTYTGPVVREPVEPTLPAAVAPPALRTQVDAENRVNTNHWYDPTTVTDPPAVVNDYKLEIRGGRQVAVVLEAESTYTVARSIVIRPAVDDGTGNLVASADRSKDIVLTAHSAAYQNEFLFDMPSYDCVIEVTYTERKAQELNLKIVGDYAPNPADNNVTVTGYGPNPGSITATAITPLTKDGDKENVLEDSVVSVLVHKDAGYSVGASVEYIDSNGQSIRVPTTPGAITDMNDGTLFTFTMPKGVTTITITYTDIRERHNAHLVFTHEGTTADTRNGGFWHGTALTDITALEGDELQADITVMPGFYIYAVEAYTLHGSYPLTLSGNGWNNGLGGNVTIETTMPDEEYWVHVVFRPGPPDPEPGQILTLRVNDPDNVGTTIADNWARVTTPIALGPLGMALDPNTLSQSGYATTGDLVKLDLQVADGFYVESIEIQPAGLGTSVTRTSATTAEFTMPAASAAVVVTFRRNTVTPDPLYLHIAKTERDQSGAMATDARNHVPTFTSPTIRPTLPTYAVPTLPATVPTGTGTRGAARPGELVELNIDVAPGWYIHSLTVSGDQGRLGYTIYQSFDRDNQATAVPYDPTTHYSNTAVTKAVATFIMPNSDAYVTVNYRKGPDDGSNPDPDPGEYEVELVVEDPENITAPYADNNASAVVSGIGADRTIAAVGKVKDALRRAASARAGEEVTITYAADTGYALEIILVTPSGLHVPVRYLGGNQAQFTMPDSAVTAIVRFKKEPAIQYTANLVLHFPAGTDYTDYDKIGEGSFLKPPTNGLDYTKLYSQIAIPGDRLDFDMLAHDGYYIETVTVGPQELGVLAPYTGSFGRQSGYVIMPAANIQINVYFKAGWPDDVKPDPTTVDYDLTLKVYDAAGSTSTSSANFESIGGTALSAPNSDPVRGGGSLTITPRQSYDEDRVVVKLNPDAGCYAQSITVTDSRGRDVPWQYVPGGIAFEMTPAHVTVTVKYAKLPDPTRPDDPNNPYKSYEVKLHTGSTNGTAVSYGDVTAMGTATLTGPDWPTNGTHQTMVNGGSFLVTVPPQGQTLTLEVTRNMGYHVAAAYAVKRSTGEQILLPMTQVPNGGTATFAMPEDNADVYVIFADNSNPDTPGPDPDRGDLPGTLTVVGPTGSGSAVMGGIIVDPTGTAADVNVSTGTVAASGAGSLYAPQGTGLTVDLTVNPGYSIAAIRVTDGYGNRLPYTWTEPSPGVAAQRQFTLTMAPTGGVRVYVELEKTTPRPTDPDDPGPEDSQLTAQVVVNNGGNSGNKAELRYGPKAAPVKTGALLSPVYAGDEIWVDLTVAPGYQVEYVKVVPAKYGIAPTLYDPPTKSQDTSFLMPGEDVVVYVKFTRDTRTRRNVTLVAAGEEDTRTNPADIENKATIKSEITHTQGPVYPVTTPHSATVQAAPPTATLPAEWVTVDYGWADGYYIQSIQVEDTAGNLVPYTQNFNDPATRKGQITFPAVDADVTVTITWGTTLPKYEAVLHVIDLDNPDVNDDSWGQLTWRNPPIGDPDKHQTAQVGALPNPGGTETLMVPAGEKVRVNAHAQDAETDTPTYIQAAFVLHRAGGQMIAFNFTPDNPGPGFTGDKEAEFIMHQGRNDVYIYYTKDPQKLTDYSAVLMLDSPASDTTSTATITRTPERAASGETVAPSDTVTANDTVKTHGYVTATNGDTITVSVTPAPGYSIESILMTPLGTAAEQGGPVVITRTGDTYTFTMPAHNVAVLVKLKEGSDKEYKATLHYKLVEIQDDGSAVVKDTDITKDWAQASYTQGGSTVLWKTDDTFEMVPEGTTVEVGASITGTDLVLAAYVLKENGDMVPLSKTLEGLTEQHTTAPDNTKLDDTTDFTMPAADVHIFVWFTNKKPKENWRTAVLTVTDSDPNDPTKDNSGKNSATMESNRNNKTPIEVWSTGVPGHQFMWVEETEVVTVKTKTIAAGYSFVAATISHSDAAATQTLNQTSMVNPYTFTYDVEAYNSAVVVRYEASPLTRNPLNVVLIDRDNPGNGTVTNAANVAVTSLPALDVRSVSSAGARQRIPDVLTGTSVTYIITPDTGYTAVARLKGSAGQILKTWVVGHNSDSFDMPNEEATLEIIYFKGYTATLSVLYTGGTLPATVPEGEMTESVLGQTLSVKANGSDTMTVSNGTELTAGLTVLGDDERLVGALVITPSGSRWLSPTAATAAGTDVDKRFTHTVAGENTEIRLIVGSKTDPNEYLATVSAVNLPAGTDAPEIHVTPTANPAEGPGWTVAVPSDTVTVTVDVPYGYKATLTTADGVTLTPDSIDGTGSAVSGGTATFTMPAHNVHVTVTYVKTRFTATIRTAGSGTGTADLTHDTTTVIAGSTPDTVYDLVGSETLSYTGTPDTGSTLTRVLMTTASGVTRLLTGGSFAMPTDDVTVTVFFDKDDEKHHIAFVTVVGANGEPLNAARDIQNTSDSTLGGGFLWAYGDETHEMRVTFSVAPGYTAKVTAKYADGTDTEVAVTQQGNTGNGTATLTMPDADVEVTITYTNNPPEDRQLKLRLVGHDQVLENQATLYANGYGSASSLSLNGTMAPDTGDLWSGNALTVKAGDPLDLDAGRHVGTLGNYIIERATIGLLDGTGTAVIPGTEVDIPLNEYGTTATGLHYMPDADAVVTVYYRLPYTATLFVVDAAGKDYNDGYDPVGPADTTADHTRVPTVTMSVDRTDLTPNSTTKTHDPIEDLNGSEIVTTQVDKKYVADSGTMPDDSAIASVIASTRSGTVHLTEDTTESTTDMGVYKYSMRDLPTRRADDVEITVVLRQKDDPLHTATVYKVGHDNKPGNKATIENPTHPALPNGDIWTGAYKDDEPVVKVTTEPGYYAIVTAVQTGTGIPVPVLQWVTQGTDADPIVTKFKMPDADVDVTVEYVTDPPEADMTLTLLHHDGEAENKGDLYEDAAAVPDLTVLPAPTAFLSANGGEAVDSSVTPPTITDPFSKTTTTPVDAGNYLALEADHGDGHYIKSITFKAAGFTFDMLNPPAGFVPRVPVSGGEIIIEFAPGKQSGRPFDPEHSERYYGNTVRLDPLDDSKVGNYVTGDNTDGNPNPDLSVAPKLEQQGWILAESPDPEKNTVVVTVPTLYDEDTTLSDTDALADAGVDLTPPDDGWVDIPPTYQFYWWDDTNSEFVPFTAADIDILKAEPLSYTNNPKGEYPKDSTGNTLAHHYGYRLTLQVVDGATSDQAKALVKYIADGGEIYVTATRPGYVPKADPDDPDIPWVESEKTQIIIKSDNVLKPYDPDNEDNPNYEDHWITSENRGDYLLVTVPMLNNKTGDNPTEVDGTKHRFQLHLQMDGKDRDSAIINVTDYLNIQNVRDYDHFWNVNLEYQGPDWRTDPTFTPTYTPYLFDPMYENEIYYTDTVSMPNVDYHGARFAVSIKDQDPDSTDPIVLALRQIFDNDGTMGTKNYRMYITSDEVDTTLTDPLATPLPNFRKDDYTDFEVPRYYSLAGDLESWAPTHIAELRLYRADTANGGYEPKPWLMLRSGLSETMSREDYDPAIYNGHWSMEFAFKSSKLADDGAVLTYKMVVKKPAHLTYTHKDIGLDTGETTLYNGTTLVFTFARPISLFCGDIAPILPGPNQKINDQDRDMLAGFNYGLYTWNEDDDQATSIDWDNSTFNPGSYAYLADLNGDGVISERDMAILMSEFNWLRRTSDYGSPAGLADPGTGIMLLMEELLAEEEAAEGAQEGEQPEEGEVPEEWERPEEGSDPETPAETPEDPNAPEAPEGSENAADPNAPETPKDPESPEEPENPEIPDSAEDPEEPKDPDSSEEPETPDEPKEPDVTDTPDEPEVTDPEASELEQPSEGGDFGEPETPSEPEEPMTPGKSDKPDVPAEPEESLPDTSDEEGAESELPEQSMDTERMDVPERGEEANIRDSAVDAAGEESPEMPAVEQENV